MTSITANTSYHYSTSPYRTDSGSSSSTGNDLLDEFSKWAHMTKAEQIREKYLEQHDLTEADLKDMSEDELKSVEDEIAQLIQRAYKMPARDPAASDLAASDLGPSLLNQRLSAMAIDESSWGLITPRS